MYMYNKLSLSFSAGFDEDPDVAVDFQSDESL